MFTAIKNLIHLGSDGYPKLSTSTILNKLSDCRPPGDKLKIGEYLEMVEIKLETFPIETAKELLKFSGLPVIFNIMRVMKDDVDIQCYIVSLVKLLEVEPTSVTEIVQMGIIDHLEEMKALHSESTFLKALIPEVIISTLDVGVRQAVRVMLEQMSHLQFCRHCLEVMHRSKNSAAPHLDRRTLSHSHAHMHGEDRNNSDRNSDPLRAGDIPENTERINSVTEYMKTYSFSDEVQVVGLDAIIVYARSAGAKKNVLSTRCVEQAEHALTSYPKNPKIVWRSLIALTNLSSLNEESSLSILGLSVHNYVIGVYVRTGDNAVRQQIMWLFNSFLSWPRSMRKIHESIDSMRLLASLPLIDRTESAITATSGQVSDPGSLVAFAVPLSIRTFLRETKGTAISYEKKAEEVKAKFIHSTYVRDKIEKKEQDTRYGTVESKIYLPGVKGILDD